MQGKAPCLTKVKRFTGFVRQGNSVMHNRAGLFAPLCDLNSQSLAE